MKVLYEQGRELGDQDDIEEIFEGNDDDNKDDDDDISALDDTQRSVKLMLRSWFRLSNTSVIWLRLNMCLGGVIPDSTMIHAARKRRQMARETGAPGDFISLKKNGDDAAKNHKSRLVRWERQAVQSQIPNVCVSSDDEHDASDDSGTEDPHIVNMDRNHTRAQSERQKNRDRFLELEQGESFFRRPLTFNRNMPLFFSRQWQWRRRWRISPFWTRTDPQRC